MRHQVSSITPIELVGQDDPRLRGQGAGDPHPLALPSGELGRVVVGLDGDPTSLRPGREQAPGFSRYARVGRGGIGWV